MRERLDAEDGVAIHFDGGRGIAWAHRCRASQNSASAAGWGALLRDADGALLPSQSNRTQPRCPGRVRSAKRPSGCEHQIARWEWAKDSRKVHGTTILLSRAKALLVGFPNTFRDEKQMPLSARLPDGPISLVGVDQLTQEPESEGDASRRNAAGASSDPNAVWQGGTFLPSRHHRRLPGKQRREPAPFGVQGAHRCGAKGRHPGRPAGRAGDGLEVSLFFASAAEFQTLFWPADDPQDVVIEFRRARVVDHSAIEAIDALAERYKAAGSRLHLRHLSPDCLEVLENAKVMIEVNVLEDPVYRIVDNKLA